jgi:hypothetical protein
VIKKLAVLLAVWVSMEFRTWAGALEFLNSLPEKQAVTAKIVTFQTIAGNGAGYGVVYRAEETDPSHLNSNMPVEPKGFSRALPEDSLEPK